MSPWRGTWFLGGAFLLAAFLLAAGFQVAGFPEMAPLGVLLLFCALGFAFLMPFLWNHLFQYPQSELGRTTAGARRPRG